MLASEVGQSTARVVREVGIKITGNSFSFTRAIKMHRVLKVTTDFVLVLEEYGPELEAPYEVKVFCVRRDEAVPIKARFIDTIISTNIGYHWYAVDPKELEKFSG